MIGSLFFLLCSSGCLACGQVYLLSDNVVTGYNKQTYVCHPFLLKAPLRASDCVSLLRLRAVSIDSAVLHRKLVISNSASDNRCACWRKMSQ